MENLKKQIDKFVDRHCHFPEYNEPKFREHLYALQIWDCGMEDEDGNINDRELLKPKP